MPEEGHDRSPLQQSLDLLWGNEKPGKRGPKPRLTVEKIARAAIAIADDDGLSAVSMQAVAAALGHTTMSLYTYVPSKDLLLEVMQDVVLPPPPQPPPAMPWREAVMQWVTEVQAVYAAHPWILRIQITHPPMGPQQLSWLEHLLDQLVGAGLPPQQAMSASLYLTASLRGMAQLSNDIALASEDAEQQQSADAEFGEMMMKAVDPQRFPQFSKVMLIEADAAVSPQVRTLSGDHFGVQRLLDGIESHIAELGNSNQT